MYEFTYQELTSDQVQGYLKRLDWQGELRADKACLDRLIYLHQCAVPFEDLDIMAGRLPVKLDRDSLYEKIVVKKRGGFCFELNGLFVLLLRAVGFEARSCICRVAANRTDLGALTHEAVLVKLDGKRYLCDVGLGGPMAPFAVELSEERQTVFGETYWIEPTHEGWFFQRRQGENPEGDPVIIFSPQAFLPQDFEPMCQFLTNDPTRVFRVHRMVNRRAKDGYRNLRDNTLVVRDGDGRREITFTDEELPEILRQWFDLELD